jgi:hypothetical protein
LYRRPARDLAARDLWLLPGQERPVDTGCGAGRRKLAERGRGHSAALKTVQLRP